MPLNLVIGPANSAKAGVVLDAYAAAAGRGAVLVVPTAADALHYDRERAQRGVALGRALTFEGLIGLIAERVGYERPLVSALARELLIRRAIRGLELESLAESAATPGFGAAVGRTLAELRAQRVTPQRFSAAAEAAGQGGYGRDLARIYQRYVARLQGDDRESRGWGVLEALRASPDTWGGVPLFFYGFDDLTPLEQDAVETLARSTAVTVSLTYEPGRAALAARARAVEELRPLATSVRQLEALDTYYEAPALHHLERHLFEPDPPRIAAGGAVQLLQAGGELAEAELVAAEVRAALAEGVQAAEIVVVCRSLARSGLLLERTLARHGVPATSARRVPFTHTALGRGVEAVARREPLAYLRLTRDPAWVDELEARVRRSGDPGPLQRIALPRDLLEAARELLPRAGGRLLTPEEQLDVRAAAVLEAALTELGGLSTEETLELLARLEVPAGAGDGVLVAEPLSIRARRFDRVFVTGLCEGEFPAGAGADAFLGEQRRRELALAAGLVLAPPPDHAAQERYLLYAAASRARQRISFSYRTSDEEGNQVMPSPFLDAVRALFDGLDVRSRALADVYWTSAQAQAGALGSGPPEEPLTRTLGGAALAQVRHARRVSPGAIETFAACPVRWLIERQLEPEDLEPEPEHFVKGNFLHEQLARILQELDGPLTRRNLAAAEAQLDGIEPPPELAPASPPAVRRAILAGIVAELRRYLRHEADEASGLVPLAFEQDFEVRLGEATGRPLEVVGRIDRIDTDGHGHVVVRDYKSGRQSGDWAAAKWVETHRLQVAIYMLAVRRVLELEPVGGFYQPLSGGDLRARGAYLDGAPVGRYAYKGDGLEPAQFSALLQDVEAEVERFAATLAAGELTPCPQTCTPRQGCAHPGICWAGR